MLTLDDFDFNLPAELIAQHPASRRSASRLLDTTGGCLTDRHIADLPELVAPGDLFVFNDTRVIKARLLGQKDTGGQVEAMIERIADGRHAVAQIRASKSPKPGSRIVLEEAFEMTVIGRTGRENEFFSLELVGDGDLYALIEAHGRLPLPPYITHAAETVDESRYQTVYARHPGAVAAPTAGLHFDDELFARLEARGAKLAWLTLHVGAGTFQPVRVHNIDDHRMHSEWFTLPAETVAAIEATRAAGGRVTAVGTTSLRALEAAAQSGTLQAGAAETDIFITPGLPLPRHRPAADQFPSPQVDVDDARLGVLRHRADPPRLCPCHRRALSFLQLRRRNAARPSGPCHFSRRARPCSLNF